MGYRDLRSLSPYHSVMMMGQTRVYYSDDETDRILERRFPKDLGRQGKKSEWIRTAIKEKDRRENDG